jgi:hypothetical protein
MSHEGLGEPPKPARGPRALPLPIPDLGCSIPRLHDEKKETGPKPGLLMMVTDWAYWRRRKYF